jgi:hypothetical protein
MDSCGLFHDVKIPLYTYIYMYCIYIYYIHIIYIYILHIIYILHVHTIYTYIWYYMYYILYIMYTYIYIWYRQIRYALMTNTSPRRSPSALSFFFALREFLHCRNYSADGQQDQPYGAMSGAHHGRNGGPGLQKSYSYLEPKIPGSVESCPTWPQSPGFEATPGLES